MKIYLNIIGLFILLFFTILESILPSTICIFFAKNKLLAIGECKKGKIKEGVWIYKYPNGNLWAIGSYSNNKKNGIWKEFYEDTTYSLRSITNYYQDKANGLRFIYDTDGFIIEKQLCKDDIILKEWNYYKDSVYDVNFPINSSVTIPNLYDSDTDNIVKLNSWFKTLKLLKIFIILVLLFINIFYHPIKNRLLTKRKVIHVNPN